TRGLPRDALVRVLLGDAGVELAVDSADAHPPVQRLVIRLVDLLDPVHERGELLKLRPLVVDGADRGLDIDVARDGGHGALLLSRRVRGPHTARRTRDTRERSS